MLHTRGVLMRIIDWNISYSGDTTPKIEYLLSLLSDEVCVMLQEVKPHIYEYIRNAIGQNYHLLYSLNYRKPSNYDSGARKLGVLIIVSGEAIIKNAGVIERSLFPDRTMYASVDLNGTQYKLLALHSITGCDYKKAKSVQFDTFSEFVDKYQPDVIGIDANEPRFDHYDISQMRFYDNGPGAKTFFETIEKNGLLDSYVAANHITECTEGLPLITSHHIRRKGNVRYDFLFVKNHIKIERMEYQFDQAISAGSDHALLLCDTVV